MDATLTPPSCDSSVEHNQGGTTASSIGCDSSVDAICRNGTTRSSEDKPFDESASRIGGINKSDYVSFSDQQQAESSALNTDIGTSCDGNDDAEPQQEEEGHQGETVHESCTASSSSPITGSCGDAKIDDDDGNDVVDHGDHDDQGHSSTSRRSVRFDTIEIREYPIQLGCSIPSCGGVPVGIDWMPCANAKNDRMCTVFNVEEYENIIKPPSARRHIEQLVLSSAHRYGM